MQKITPFLWFDDKAEEAVKFYVSVFRNSRIGGVARYGEAGAPHSTRPSSSSATVEFKPSGKGTTLVVTEHGAFLDGYDDSGSRERGTRALVDQLEKELRTE